MNIVIETVLWNLRGLRLESELELELELVIIFQFGSALGSGCF